MDKQLINLTIFLIKDYIEDFDDCLKYPQNLQKTGIKSHFALDGYIYYCESIAKPPRWKAHLEELSNKEIAIDDNSSNKAIMIVKIKNRIMAIVFGYGRAFLKEECIERNFGFKVALNVINQNKMRSVNAATIEDMVVTTQRQSSYSASQEEFGLNIINDIMNGVTGEPFNAVYGNHISGKDSLVVSVFMELIELKEKLTLYLEAYEKTRYKDIGFDWVDNVGEVRDSMIKEELDFKLVESIELKNIDHLHIAPPETTDWKRIIGFCYSGIGKKIDDQDNYNLNLDLSIYLDAIKPDTNIYQKIKRDRLYAMTADGIPFVICSIYTAFIFQTEYEEKTYILCSGNWYQVDKAFFETVHNYINTYVPISNIKLPNCPADKTEGDYNIIAANSNEKYCHMDKKMISVKNGPKQIEACDIFTADKQLIHVKNKGQSSQLSHLFSQGKVSSQCLISDESFRKQIYDIVNEKFGHEVFNYKIKPNSNEFEVIYAIIDNKENSTLEKLPFFSLVNLMITAQELDRMHMKYSVCFIRRNK